MDSDIILLMRTIEAHLRHTSHAQLSMPETIRDHLEAFDHWLRRKRIIAAKIMVTPMETPHGRRGGMVIVRLSPAGVPLPSMLPLCRCHLCDALFDKVSAAQPGGRIEPGGVAFCIACGAVSVFKDDLTIVEPTPEDFERFIEHPDWSTWKAHAEEHAFRNLIFEPVDDAL